MLGKNTDRITEIIKKILCPVLLVIAVMWDFNKGLDFTDAGYNLERFYNYFTYDPSSRLSKFWSDYIGHLLTRLPGGDTWLGITLYCMVVIIAIVLIAYHFCCLFLDYRMVFVCEIVAIALYWLQPTVLYNSLTFLLLEIAIVLLHYALKKNGALTFFAAGVVLGINTLVRMPNIAEVILILLVWVYAWLNRRELQPIGKMPWVVAKTLLCVAGYVAGVVASLLYSLRFASFDDYFKAVNHLSGNTSVEGYSLIDMAFGTLFYILEHGIYVVILTVVFGLSVFWVRKIERINISPKLIGIARKLVFVCTVVVTIVAFYCSYRLFDWFTFDYSEYSSVKGIMAMVFFWGMVMCAANVVWKSTQKEIMVSVLYLLLLWVVPLGSNNQIYLDISNSFLLLPFICYLTKNFIEKIKEEEWRREERIWSIPLKLILGCISIFVLFQTLMFGRYFTFRDSNVDTIILEKNSVYGMRTSEQKATAISGLLEFLETEEVEYSSIIQYCDSPGLVYVLQTKSGIGNSWPELTSCTLEKLTLDLEETSESGEFPMIILTDELAAFFQKIYRCEDIYVDREKEIEYFYDEKVRALMDFMSRNHYQLIYNDQSMYAVYIEKK